MRQYAVPESIPYTICYNAQNAHLAEYAAKCYKNAGKFFPDVIKSKYIIQSILALEIYRIVSRVNIVITIRTTLKIIID